MVDVASAVGADAAAAASDAVVADNVTFPLPDAHMYSARTCLAIEYIRGQSTDITFVWFEV